MNKVVLVEMRTVRQISNGRKSGADIDWRAKFSACVYSNQLSIPDVLPKIPWSCMGLV